MQNVNIHPITRGEKHGKQTFHILFANPKNDGYFGAVKKSKNLAGEEKIQK